MFFKKLQDENEELKGSITRLKLQDEKLQDLKKKVEIWETTQRNWTKALETIRNNKRLWIVRRKH